MRKDFYYDSCGEGKIHGCIWIPEGNVAAVVQIVHGIAEFVERYDHFARYLNDRGIVVVAEDHMGHGKSAESGTKGYFAGGWMNAVDDTYHLLRDTMGKYPEVPYVLFGHSMGSFMARSILLRYPDSGIAGAVICGTGWIPDAVVGAGLLASKAVCKMIGERNPSEQLQGLVFGSYNKRIEYPRTPYDWLSRDKQVVDAYIADPMCGFTASCGLLRDMLSGIAMIQNAQRMQQMDHATPVLLIAGGDDPVGSYGEGVNKCAREFRRVGMEDVTLKLFPLCRHEILNEINKEEVYGYVWSWISEKVLKISEKVRI